ncbi:NUDIX domain-containing protein [Salinisphaera sp. USBA-960]|nr:NUDIX domain-containing protein [Salifodinibacter halophilus]NNC26984.1 NUDIX domain-containing protein [Salifodinibacter halophilus]
MNDTEQTGDTSVAAVRSAATVACVRDGPAGLEVVLLRRAASHVFCPGAHVFPGGAVDAEDMALAESGSTGQTDTSTNVQEQARRLTVAREAFEEAGLLVGVHAAHTLASTDLTTARAQLNAGRMSWADVRDQLGLSLAPETLVAIGFRQTPPGWPRRYATQFFLARADADADPTCDGTETDAAGWWSPQDTLHEADAGRIELVRPTRIALTNLARYACVADLFAACSDRNQLSL